MWRVVTPSSLAIVVAVTQVLGMAHLRYRLDRDFVRPEDREGGEYLFSGEE